MADFGNIVVSRDDALTASRGYRRHIESVAPSAIAREIADRVGRAMELHRLDMVELPMDSPLVDFLPRLLARK